MRRSAVFALLAPVVFVLCGCSTYREKVSSVLLSQDQKQLVFATEKYHYIFDAPPVIVETLNSAFRRSVTANFSSFAVDEENKITGTVYLKMEAEAPREDKSMALTAGYRELSWSGGPIGFGVTIHGARYVSRGVRIPVSAQALNRSYVVVISTPETKGQKTLQAALTPISKTAEGVLAIGSTPLIAVGAVGLAAVCIADDCR